jgi:hypothetical protein
MDGSDIGCAWMGMDPFPVACRAVIDRNMRGVLLYGEMDEVDLKELLGAGLCRTGVVQGEVLLLWTL